MSYREPDDEQRLLKEVRRAVKEEFSKERFPEEPKPLPGEWCTATCAPHGVKHLSLDDRDCVCNAI